MIDFSNFLKENLNGIFTTVEDGKPKSRAFQFLFADGKKVYFCTENKSGHWKNHEKMEAEGEKGDGFAVFYEVKVKSLQNEKQICIM